VDYNVAAPGNQLVLTETLNFVTLQLFAYIWGEQNLYVPINIGTPQHCACSVLSNVSLDAFAIDSFPIVDIKVWRRISKRMCCLFVKVWVEWLDEPNRTSFARKTGLASIHLQWNHRRIQKQASRKTWKSFRKQGRVPFVSCNDTVLSNWNYSTNFLIYILVWSQTQFVRACLTLPSIKYTSNTSKLFWIFDFLTYF